LKEETLKHKLAGKFIVIDGPDGCGKTTQIKLLHQFLKNEGIDVISTMDPGGTSIGNKIRKLLKYGSEGIDVATEALLFMASRAQLAGEVIRPAIEKGQTVLCDRYISSTCAYQGAGGYPIEKILELGRYTVGNIWPSLTIILDLPPKTGRERAGVGRSKKGNQDFEQNHLFDSPTADMFDLRTLEYHNKVRKEFLKLQEYYPGIVKVIDVSRSDIETVHENIKQIISETDFNKCH
jgi:dTMP kinase